MKTYPGFNRMIRNGNAIIAVVCLVLFFLSSGCSKGNEEPPKPKKAPLVTVATVMKGDMTRTLSLNGTVTPYRLAKLASPAEGPVVDFKVREGDSVKAGAVLLSIGRKSGVDALISSLREELKKEADNLKRTRQLVSSGALPGESLDQARSSHEKIKAQLENARQSGRDYSISAPWNGVVSRVMVTEGDFVMPRLPLVEIYDPSSLIILAAVPEKEASLIQKGMTAVINLDAHPGKSFAGQISRVYPYLDEKARTRTIELKADTKAKLLPGMFSRISLTLETFPDAVTVPTESVLISPSGASIAFVAMDGTAVKRKVKTGIEADGRIHILSGLAPGERVIVSGHEKLKEGATIRLPNPPAMSGPSGESGKKGPDTPATKNGQDGAR